jgi:hypothetical protein
MNPKKLVKKIQKLRMGGFCIKIGYRSKTIQTEQYEKQQEIRKGKWPT